MTVKEDSQVLDEFRSIVRTAAAISKISIADLVKEKFEPLATIEDNVQYLTFDAFEVGYSRLKIGNNNEPSSSMSWRDLNEIFQACDDSGDGKVTLSQFHEFVRRTPSNILCLALKLRASILKAHKSEVEYRNLFGTIEKKGNDASVDGFRTFVEEEMGIPISESDTLALYAVVDSNRDGKVSLDDFLEFLVSQSTMAQKALSGGSTDVIVDIRFSKTREDDTILLKQGYIHVLPSDVRGTTKELDTGSFGGGQSLWVWKRKQGIAQGRFKAITDIYISNSNTSTDLVVNGFTCISTRISGNYIWIRRAKNDEEERDALLDINISSGKIKSSGNKTDPIHTSPGVGWIRTENHLSFGSFSATDYLVWMLPNRSRSTDSYLARPTAVALQPEARTDTLNRTVRDAIRHYVPIGNVSELCNNTMEPIDDYELENYNTENVDDDEGKSTTPTTTSAMNNNMKPSTFDFSILFHQFADRGKMSGGGFNKLLHLIGCNIASGDQTRLFSYFDIEGTGYISRDCFSRGCVLTNHEVDVIVERIKKKLSYEAAQQNATSRGANAASNVDSPGFSGEIIRNERILANIFNMVNRGGRFLTVVDIIAMAMRLGIYLTVEEAIIIEKNMDRSGDGRVEESDFIQFMMQGDKISEHLSRRVSDYSAAFRRWLNNAQIESIASNNNSNNITINIATSPLWKEFKDLHKATLETPFLEHLIPSDLRSMVSRKLRLHLSDDESKLLSMCVAPSGHGQVKVEDLLTFSKRNVRSFGEIFAVLERHLLKPVLDLYRELQTAISKGNTQEIRELKIEMQGYEAEIADAITGIAVTGQEQMKADGAGRQSSTMTIATLSQLKEGLEDLLEDQHELDSEELPNLEEWALITVFVGSSVTTNGLYGVDLDNFVKKICEKIAGSAEGIKVKDGKEHENLMSVCRDLQKMIREEAASHAISGSGDAFDFRAPFALFDTDGNGRISLGEFKAMLEKVRLIDNLDMDQLPSLLSRFDRINKGYIDLADFKHFAESGKFGLPEPNAGMNGNSLINGDPPAAITQDAECDLLLWHIWRRCCTVEPLDPESVITTLERTCAEVEVSRDETFIGSRDLWSILGELDLRVGLSLADYKRGIATMSRRNHGGVEAVDAGALCRATVRMGRAFVMKEKEIRVEDERNYHSLVINLQEELRTSGEVHTTTGTRVSSGGKKNVLRFEHVMYRLDEDGDGRLSVFEFQVALKRLRYKEARKWTDRLVKRLFQDVDGQSDDFVSIRDLGAMVRGGELGRSVARPSSSPSSRNNTRFFLDDLDDEEDTEDKIFSKKRALGDQSVIQKAYEVLSSVVPRTGASTLHADAVCGAVRRFFLRSDPNGQGVVADSRFRTFCRRSGLQDRLTLTEIQRLTDKFKRRRTNNREGAVLVDYEKFCDVLMEVGGYGSLNRVGDHVSDTRTEAVLLKIQDAVAASAASGRPFPSLCALLDHRGTGWLLRDELIHVVKMMGATLSDNDIDLLIGLLPASAVSEGGASINHIEVLKLVDDYMPRSGLSGDLLRRVPGRDIASLPGVSFDFEHTAMRPSGALPLYASPAGNTGLSLDGSYAGTSAIPGSGYGLNSLGTIGPMSAIVGPGGRVIGTPYANSVARSHDQGHPSMHAMHAGGLTTPGYPIAGLVPVYDPAIISLAQRVRDAQELRMRNYARTPGGSMNDSLSLGRQIEALDVDRTGTIPIRSLQALCDGLGVPISAMEIFALRTAFGVTINGPAQDIIEYAAFCLLVDRGSSGMVPEMTTTGYNSSMQASGGFSRMAGTVSTPGAPEYLSDWVLRRYKELCSSGQNPRDLFEVIDDKLTGMIPAHRFREIMERIDLLQSDRHISMAERDFGSLGDRGSIQYDNFCSKLERAVRRLEASLSASGGLDIITSAGMGVGTTPMVSQSYATTGTPTPVSRRHHHASNTLSASMNSLGSHSRVDALASSFDDFKLAHTSGGADPEYSNHNSSSSRNMNNKASSRYEDHDLRRSHNSVYRY